MQQNWDYEILSGDDGDVKIILRLIHRWSAIKEENFFSKGDYSEITSTTTVFEYDENVMQNIQQSIQ